MPDKGTIALVVDNPLRDLAGVVLLATELCSRGYEALLVPVNILSDAWAFDPDFFVLNYHRSINDYQVRRIAGRGRGFAILDTEGAYPDLDHFASTLSSDAELRGKASAVCMWGGKMARFLVEKGLYAPEKVRVTGCPRFDFFHPSLAEAARKRSEEFLPASEPFVLVTGSAAVANPGMLTEEEEFESFQRNTKMGLDWCTAFREEQRGCLKALVEVTDSLASDFPGALFVLRPHPFENPAPYAPLLEKHANLRFVQKGSIDGFVLRAKAVVLRTGTATFEAALGRAPAFSFAWIPVKHQRFEEADAILHSCASYPEMRERVARVLDGTYEPPAELREKAAGILRERFHEQDGKAHVRTADAICEALARMDRGAVRGLASLKFRGAAARIARRKFLAAWRGSVKGFDGNAVRGIVDGFQALPLGDFPSLLAPVEISPLGPPRAGSGIFRNRCVLMRPRPEP